MIAAFLALQAAAGPYDAWPNGPPKDPGFFPIGVWLQNPANAKAYQAAGINTFVGIYRGPTDAQMGQLKVAGMRLVCPPNAAALARKDNPTIIAWMHGDEPDNAQALRGGGYGPPVAPSKVVEDYERLRKADPTRPVFLNLGQGVAWDDYVGRGVRTRHPEDYPEYLKGCDLASFDIYPAVHEHPAVAGKLWYVPKGVERLRQWSGDRKPVWNCIEASRIDNEKVKPSPAQVRAEVWMSLIKGSRGIIYFVHQFKPNFVEASLLRDPELLTAVTAINREIRELAPVLNSPTVKEGPHLVSMDPEAGIWSMTKRHEGAVYVFAVGPGERAVPTRFTEMPAGVKVEVLFENRTIERKPGGFDDDLPAYGVRLYRLR